MAIGAVALVLVMRDSLIASVRSAAVARAEDVAAELQSGKAPGQLSLADSQDLVIQVLDASGIVVAASPRVAGRPPIARLAVGASREVRLPVDEDPYLAVGVAAHGAGGSLVVVVARSVDSVAEATSTLTRLLAKGLPVVLLLVGVITWLVLGRALAPVEAIRIEVDEISASQLNRRVPFPPGSDEIARLARTMNRMLDRLEQGQARQRRFISDASHELRSPVATIRQHAEVALAHPDRTAIGELAETVLAEDLRVQRLVEDLLLLARADEHTLELSRAPVDLDDLVLEEAKHLRESTDLRIDASTVSAARVGGDAAALGGALRNLGENAAHHARGRIALAVAQQEGSVVLAVDDDGPGIPDGERERVFERFVRLDEARARDGGGSGLGLAIVAEVVAAHRGSVTIAKSELGGARIEVRLPAAD
jgi:signal transduction histidine kinase